MTDVDLADRIAICDTIYRYAAGLDRRDWEAFRAIFTDEVKVDFSSYDGRTNYVVPFDEWLAQVRPLFTGLAATQHSMTNPRVWKDGERTICEMYMQAEHVLDHDDPDAWFTFGGYYTDVLVKSDRGWLLSEVTLNVYWRRGRPEIMTAARERGNQMLARNSR